MKKFFVSVFVMAVTVTGSALSAQDVEATLDQAAETVEAVAVDEVAPADPAAADAQESVSDGVALEQAVVPVASDVIYDAGVVVAGEMPMQAMAQPSCCNPCCQQPSFVQPVVFNQPVFNQPVFDDTVTGQAMPVAESVASSIVSPAPVPAAPVYSQPVSSGCSSCSGGSVVNYAPEATSYAPMATSYDSGVPTTSYAAAPMESSYVSAPVAAAPVVSSGCNSCGGSVSYAPSTNACCQPSGLFQRGGGGGFSLLRRGLFIGRLIDN